MKDATGKIYNRSAKEVKILPNGNIQYIDGTEVDAVSKEKISELLAGDRFRKQQLARMNSGRSSERDMTKNLYVKEENGSIKRNPDELNLPYNYQIGTNKQGQMIFLEGSDKGKLVPNPEKYKKVTKYNANAYFSPEAYLNTTIVNTMSGFDKIFLDKPELIKDWNEKIKSPKDLDLAVRGEFPKMFETYNLFNNIKDGSTKDLYSEITSLYPDLPISSVYQQTNVSGDPIVTIVEDKEVTKDDESFVKKLSTSMSPRDAAAYIEWLKRGKDKKAKGIQGRESWESYKNILMSSDAMYNLEKDGVSIGK